jgi:Uma2 family endonuclease
MNQLQTEISNNVWIATTWQEYITIINQPQYEEKGKSYYFNGYYRLQMTPIGSDHSCDHSVVLTAVNFFTAINNIKATSRDNCTYRKAGVIEVQPDISYHLGENADIIPYGTGIVDLNIYPVPDFVIEIGSTSFKDDITKKCLMYEQLKVKEYWVIDVKKADIIAFKLEPDNTQRIYQSLVLPSLSISLLKELLQKTRQMNQSQAIAWFLTQI